jgi:hypothetical protein
LEVFRPPQIQPWELQQNCPMVSTSNSLPTLALLNSFNCAGLIMSTSSRRLRVPLCLTSCMYCLHITTLTNRSKYCFPQLQVSRTVVAPFHSRSSKQVFSVVIKNKPAATMAIPQSHQVLRSLAAAAAHPVPPLRRTTRSSAVANVFTGTKGEQKATLHVDAMAVDPPDLHVPPPT